jgi:hypothetical protein
VLIAAFHFDASARCGAFVDEPRVVAATKAAECGPETLIQPRRISKSRGVEPTCRRSSRHPTSGGRSSTGVRVPVAVVHRGRCFVERRRAQRCAKLDLERITAIFTSAGSSPPFVTSRPRVAARSSICGASELAAWAAAGGRERLIRSLSALRLRRHYSLRWSSGRQCAKVPAVRSGSRG